MNATVPRRFLKRLQRKLKRFRKLSDGHQRQLATVIWNLPRYRKHNLRDGWYSISHQELERRFGRGGFARANGLVQALEQSEHLGLGSTKAYRLTEEVAGIKERFMERDADRGKPLTMIYEDGRRVGRVWKNAIAPKDKAGATVKAWGGVSLPSRVPVNVGELGRSEKALKRRMRRPSSQGDLWEVDVDLQERLNATRQLLVLANTKSAGEGHVAHRYVESDEGRLYAIGFNLQTVPRLVRACALRGCWDYDIDNAHYTLLAQMAHRMGLSCPVIDAYVADKRSLRLGIARRIGIKVDQVKRILISLIYGAKMSVWEERGGRKSAIVKEIGPVKATQLFLDEGFRPLYREVQTVRKAILQGWERRRSRAGLRLINGVGKGIDHNADPKEALSHLLQGAEAQILREVVRTHPQDVLLPLHDGFVSRNQLDVNVLAEEAEKATGWRVTFEERRLQPSANMKD